MLYNNYIKNFNDKYKEVIKISKTLIVTISDALKKKIEDEAKNKNISQSAVVNVILSIYYKEGNKWNTIFMKKLVRK